MATFFERFFLRKAKDRLKVNRPDRIETVGPKKWVRPVSVQLRCIFCSRCFRTDGEGFDPPKGPPFELFIRL